MRFHHSAAVASRRATLRVRPLSHIKPPAGSYDGRMTRYAGPADTGFDTGSGHHPADATAGTGRWNVIGAFNKAVEATYGQPGPELSVRPFVPGSVTGPAAFMKLGSSIFAAARARANYRQQQEKAKRDIAYSDLQMQDLQNRVTAGKPTETTVGTQKFNLTPGEGATIAAGQLPKPQPAARKVKWPGMKGVPGLEEAGDYDEPVLNNLVRIAQERIRANRRLGGGTGGARAKYSAAESYEKDLGRESERNVQRGTTEFGKIADRLAGLVLKGKEPDPKAAAMLGINLEVVKRFRDTGDLSGLQGYVDEVKGQLVKRYGERQKSRVSKALEPGYRKAASVKAEAAGMLDQEHDTEDRFQQFLDNVQNAQEQ